MGIEREVRLDISDREGRDEVTHREDVLVSMSSHRQIFSDEPSVGNCFCGELDVELMIPTQRIPHNAKLVPYVCEPGGVWQKKSEFYVYTRNEDELTGVIHLVCYDAIYRGEESFLTEGDMGEWPRSDLEVMTEIARRTKAPICQDTLAILTKGYQIPFPGIIIETDHKIVENSDGTKSETHETRYQTGGEGALSMREIAGRIAAFYGGNWIIDNNGEWRLILLGDIPAETNYLIYEKGDPLQIGGDHILVVDGRAESHRLALPNGDTLRIGGVNLLV